MKSKLTKALVGAAIVAGLVAGGAAPAQAATGQTNVSKGCSLGQQVAVTVTPLSTSYVTRQIQGSFGYINGPAAYPGGSSTWYTGQRSGLVIMSSNASYSYSVWCA